MTAPGTVRPIRAARPGPPDQGRPDWRTPRAYTRSSRVQELPAARDIVNNVFDFASCCDQPAELPTSLSPPAPSGRATRRRPSSRQQAVAARSALWTSQGRTARPPARTDIPPPPWLSRGSPPAGRGQLGSPSRRSMDRASVRRPPLASPASDQRSAARRASATLGERQRVPGHLQHGRRCARVSRSSITWRRPVAATRAR